MSIKLKDTISDNIEKLSTSTAGSSTNPVYFNNGKPVACGFSQYSHPTYTERTGKPTANATPGFGGTFTVSQITSNSLGHVTEATDRTITIPSTTATTSTAGLMSATDKTKLDGIASGANKYSLPKATASVLGGIIASNVLTTSVTLTSANGSTSSRYYGVQVDKDGKAFVNVPWESGSVSGSYLPLAGGIMSENAKITFANGNGATVAMDLNNSYITGVNSLVLADSCNGSQEGIQFPRADNSAKYDSLWVKDGVAYLGVNATSYTEAAGTNYTIYHSGNISGALTNYVTLNTAQTISGAKTFSDTISISSGKGINADGEHGLLGDSVTSWTGLPSDGSAVGIGRVDKKLYFRTSGDNLYHYRQDKTTSYLILDSSNYTSYTVTKTGSGASGTWGINISGTSNGLVNQSVTYSNLATKSGTFSFLIDGADHPWTGADANGIQIGDSASKTQLAFPHAGQLWFRTNDSGGTNSANWADWSKCFSSSDGSLWVDSAGYANQLILNRNDAKGACVVKFSNTLDGHLGDIGIGGSQSDWGINPLFQSNTGTVYGLLHSGNISSYALSINGGTLKGPLTFPGHLYRPNYAIDLVNGDIINLNGIYTNDTADGGSEGYQFKRSNGNFDSIWCKDGTFYFSPNGDGSTYSTNYTVIHSGNYTSYLSGGSWNGGTITGSIILKGSTTTDMTYAGNSHPRIRFDNEDSSQNVAFIFTDYDSYRNPAGIKLVGNQGNEWFEAPQIHCSSFYIGGSQITFTT